VPHRVERTGARDGFDLIYSDDPPSDSGLWMAASSDAWLFLGQSGRQVTRVIEIELAGESLRLPEWGRLEGAGSAVAAPREQSRLQVPDLAASAFFFLSRWEEWQAPERDGFGRYPLAASVFGRGLWSLTECPVEAYVGALRRALEAAPRTAWLSDAYQAGKMGIWREGSFAVGLSHDIDSVQRWDARGFARSGRATASALLRGAARTASREFRQLASGIRSRVTGRDPHLNLEEIASRERQAGTRSTFFLLPRHTHRWDGTHPHRYQRMLPTLGKCLVQMGEVGVHASTAAATAEALQAERERLSELIGVRARGVRFHNLRGGYAALPLVASAGFSYDSTLGFAEQPGFAAGLARPFRPYDRERDAPLDLVELPLAVMDTTLLSSRYLGLQAGVGRERALGVLEVVRRRGGAAALLWHNDNLPPNDTGGYADLYWELIDWVRESGGRVGPLEEIVDEWKHARDGLRG
jgi:hypothetical protein